MRYRRSNVTGATYFFTVAAADRRSSLLVDRIDTLRSAVASVKRRHPFSIDAFVVLPDHLHTVWTLPPGDADFSTRWALLKATFSRALPAVECASASRQRKGERGLWQRRFWEHLIRDDDDLARHVDYVHFNPVKHGYVRRASEWPYSSIHKYIRSGLLAEDWGGDAQSAAGDFGEP
jgi:putative transposase